MANLIHAPELDFEPSKYLLSYFSIFVRKISEKKAIIKINETKIICFLLNFNKKGNAYIKNKADI